MKIDPKASAAMKASCKEIHSYGFHVDGRKRAVELQIDADMMTEAEADSLAKYLSHGIDLIRLERAKRQQG